MPFYSPVKGFSFWVVFLYYRNNKQATEDNRQAVRGYNLLRFTLYFPTKKHFEILQFFDILKAQNAIFQEGTKA